MTLVALREALAAQGGALAEVLVAPGEADAAGLAVDAGPGAAPPLAARGPRAAGREAEYGLLLEMILEGSLLHYGSPRVLRVSDPDLALLLGDRLYALGLSRLAELGDLDAVGELADLISLLAQAQAAGDQRLAEAIWLAGAAAIGWGSTPAHEAAKQRARAGDGHAVQALDAARSAVLTGAGGERDVRLNVDCTLTGAFNVVYPQLISRTDGRQTQRRTDEVEVHRRPTDAGSVRG